MSAAPSIDLSAIPAAQRAAVLVLMKTVAALTEDNAACEGLFGRLKTEFFYPRD